MKNPYILAAKFVMRKDELEKDVRKAAAAIAEKMEQVLSEP
ncbi:MAG: hypothetical protein RAO92_10470 [Candidatus Euphemobacter frigidus]|nr:hypothetical protein [Candidatus Euphemobacter frigidus]